MAPRSCTRRHAASFSMSLRGAKRRDNPFSLRQRITKSNTLGKYGKCYEFAKTAASLPGPSAGTRIATPVCALVRNDRLGRCVRTRGQLQCTTFLPGDADCHRCDHWLAMTPPPCHCEERSDVAIRILCGRAQQKAVLWANSSGTLDRVLQQPTCQVSLRGCGLPHQCAHWFAMTCRRRVRVRGCKDVPPCHCEERSDVAIRILCGST